MLREFTDTAGTKWRVFDVNPSVVASELGTDVGRVQSFPSKAHADGWLCFESATEKRRLAPIPPEWEICDLEKLEAFCERAGFVSRTTPTRIDGAPEARR